MILELEIKVPYGNKDDIEEAKIKWRKILSRMTLFKIRSKKILYEITDIDNERFVWHIKVKDKGLFLRDKSKQIRLVGNAINMANLMANEALNNNLAKKNIKKRTGYTIIKYCRNNDIDYDNLSEDKKNELTAKINTEYDELYNTIKNESGAKILEVHDDSNYDFKNNKFKETEDENK